jgi:hypothetical protein
MTGFMPDTNIVLKVFGAYAGAITVLTLLVTVTGS